jgi:hypothetical protein
MKAQTVPDTSGSVPAIDALLPDPEDNPTLRTLSIPLGRTSEWRGKGRVDFTVGARHAPPATKAFSS